MIGRIGSLVSQIVGDPRIVQSYTSKNCTIIGALPFIVSCARYEAGGQLTLFSKNLEKGKFDSDIGATDKDEPSGNNDSQDKNDKSWSEKEFKNGIFGKNV